MKQTIKVAANDGITYGEIIKMKQTVDPMAHDSEIMTIRRTQKEHLIALGKKSNTALLSKDISEVVGAQATVQTMIPNQAVKIRDIDETVDVKEVCSKKRPRHPQPGSETYVPA